MDIVRTLGVAIDPSAAKSGGAQASAAFKGVGEAAAKGAEKNTMGLSGACAFLKTALAGIGVAAFVRELYGTSTAIQRFQNQLKFASEGAGDARRNMEFIRGTAKQLGMDLLAAGSSFGSFAAAAKGKLTSGQIRDTFLAVSEASTAMGLSVEQTSGALTALGQMLSKGTVQAEELRGQLGERLYGAFSLAAQSMGKTEKELGKILESGGLMADELLPRLAVKLHETFRDDARTGAQSLAASMNRVKNSWVELQAVVMSSGGDALFSRVLQAGQAALDSLKQWLAAMFEASAEGRLSEAVAASLRIGFGKAANYFGGFIVTAGDMMAEVGKRLFTKDYFAALLGSFQSVAAGFGLAILEAFKKPLAYVQATMEQIFDGKNRQLGAQAGMQATADVNRQFGVKSRSDLTGVMLPVWAQNAATQSAVSTYDAAIARRTAQLEKQLGVLSITDRVDQIMASGGPRLGFGGDGMTIAEMKDANQKNLAVFTGQLSQLTADMSGAALAKLKDFKPLGTVDTSADEATLAAFARRSPNMWTKDVPAPNFGEAGIPKTRSLLDDFREGLKEQATALRDMHAQFRKAGAETTDALASNFSDFWSDLVTKGGSAIDKIRNMFSNLAKDIATIFSRRMIAEPLAGGLASWLGGALGGSLGGAGAGGSWMSGLGQPTPVLHTGGLVGAYGGMSRSVHPGLFNNAPRFHSGLAPDEFPAILQRGERVTPKGQAGRGGGDTYHISVNVDGSKGGTPESNQRLGADVARQLEQMMDARIARAAGPRGILSRA